MSYIDDLTSRINDLLTRQNATGVSAHQIVDEVRKSLPEELATLGYHTGDGAGRQWCTASSWVRAGQYIAIMQSPDAMLAAKEARK